MRKKRVTITLPDDSDESGEIMSTLLDALSEFVSHRAEGDGQSYIDKRYPLDEKGCCYVGDDRARKVAEVERRCRLARNMRQGIHVEIVDTEWSDP